MFFRTQEETMFCKVGYQLSIAFELFQIHMGKVLDLLQQKLKDEAEINMHVHHKTKEHANTFSSSLTWVKP